jgi:hypothetical protein
MDVARALTSETVQVLGVSEVVAVILHGSLASGDYVSGVSDIDILVVVREPPPQSAMRELEHSVRMIAQRHGMWLDYRVVTIDTARQPPQEPAMEFYIGLHPGVPGGEVIHGPVAEKDLLFEFAICREHGRSLFGGPATEVIGAVRESWLLDLGDAVLQRWQQIGYEEACADLMVFTACRLWCRAIERRHLSKAAAARWVLSRAPGDIAPRLALQRRESDPNGDVVPDAVMDLLATVRGILAERR